MTLNEIKKRILEYKDFYGGDIPDTSRILNAKTKSEFYCIIEEHRKRLEDMLADAHSHLDNFKKELGLNYSI